MNDQAPVPSTGERIADMETLNRQIEAFTAKHGSCALHDIFCHQICTNLVKQGISGMKLGGVGFSINVKIKPELARRILGTASKDKVPA